jgi:hypothetical protein
MRYHLRTLMKRLFPPSEWELIRGQRFGLGFVLMIFAVAPLGYGADTSNWPLFWFGMALLVIGECVAVIR